MRDRLFLAFMLGLVVSSCEPGVAALPTNRVATVEAVTTVQLAGATQATLIAAEDTRTPDVLPMPQGPTPIPTLAHSSSPTELKYRVLAQFPDFFFCDPDFYPLARSDEQQLALERFPEIQADPGVFQSILQHNALSGLLTFTDGQELLIYREYKKLAALRFQLDGDRYQFQLQTKNQSGAGFAVKGWIDGGGQITIEERVASFPTCPICLAADTRIATPQGAVAVQDLRAFDTVWTLSASGARIAASVLERVRVAVPAGHEMVHLVLADGRQLWASPGHPTTDGRRVGDLKAGDSLDGSAVTVTERVPYDQGFTYDLLPAGPTGAYWANGILLESTLHDN